MTDFQTFMKEREKAALDYTKGDATAVDNLTADSEDVSFFGPDGKALRGSQPVIKAFDQGAAQFGPAGESRLEILHQDANGDVGFWSGLQHAIVEMGGKRVPMTLRITELFRRFGQEWKLIHRHADMLKV